MDKSETKQTGGLTRYLPPLGVWALSFGCAVGWGAFVMPGTTFLPAAGPLGTAVGIIIGAAVMFIIGMNYHFLMNKYPDAGGTLTYSIRTFGYDHGFLSSWFLMLVYIAIIWANATALTLIARNLFGSAFQFGFYYQILGYDVYLGEALLSIAAILIFGLICIKGKRLAISIQIALALALFFGISLCAFFVYTRHTGGVRAFMPAFAPNGRSPVAQIFGIVALAPWAFVGFESVSNSTADFRFSPKKSIWIMGCALLTGALSYILLSEIAIAVLPQGYGNWTDYLADLGNLSGLEGLPTFYVIHAAMGKTGMAILGVAVCGAIITGLVGNYIAASRLLFSMAEDGILPKWFGKVNADGSPNNALLFLTGISVLIPFLGRTAIGWIVDVNTIGATIAYGYTSAAALVTAHREGNRVIKISGILGVAMSVLFFFYFMSWSAGAMATESYLILAGWSILGFLYSRYMFSRDKERRFGKSTVVWIGLTFLIFFTTLMWVKQSTREVAMQVLANLNEYNTEEMAERGVILSRADIAASERYIQQQLQQVNDTLAKNSMIQMLLTMVAILIMVTIYNTMSKREKEQEYKRALAEESSAAKTTFLSNMSHDIRTPMNAIIGYTNLAEKEDNDLPAVREYLRKIKTSSQHLLALINDVLEMSRIESGKMDLETIEMDLRKTMGEVRDMFATQMEEKKISFVVDSSHVKNSRVMCDKNRLNRVLLNLLSNAYKFTPEGGDISVTLWQVDTEEEGRGTYELRVKDSGIGMSPEFAARVFEAFERERTSTVSGIQGTGLGMAITKSIVDLMGGTIEVITAPGQGTEFVIRISLELQQGAEAAEAEKTSEEGGAEEKAPDFNGMKLLLVEDNEINREIATMILSESGFVLDTAVNGQDAVDKVKGAAPGDYDAILMDIQMPVMNGYDAARAIRKLDNPDLASLPIIAMTANAFSEDMKAAAEAGMNGHIAKPIDVAQMLQTLTEVLKSSRKA